MSIAVSRGNGSVLKRKQPYKVEHFSADSKLSASLVINIKQTARFTYCNLLQVTEIQLRCH